MLRIRFSIRGLRELGWFALRASLLLLLFCNPAWALSGTECIEVCESGSELEFRAMLDAHPMTELYRVRSEGGRGLMHLALHREEYFWKALIEHGWPLDREKGWTPLHEAALLGIAPVVPQYKEKGANLATPEPYNGGTALHIAAFNGHFEVVRQLVRAGASVNLKDKEGWTALAQAQDQGYPKIVDWLKKNGAK